MCQLKYAAKHDCSRFQSLLVADLIDVLEQSECLKFAHV